MKQFLCFMILTFIVALAIVPAFAACSTQIIVVNGRHVTCIVCPTHTICN